MAAFAIVMLLLFPLFFGFDTQPATPDPPRDFKQLTGWALPSDAQILRAENTFSGFKGDGDYTLIVKTSSDRLESWVADSESDIWMECPIPSEIQEACWNLPYHSGKLYRVIKVMDTDDDWHRGSIVLLNPDSGMVWVYAWKT